MQKTGIPSLLALMSHTMAFFMYLITLYSGLVAPVFLKACMYVFIASIMIFLIIDEWNGYYSAVQWQCNTINKFFIATNFLLVAFTIFDIYDAVNTMILYGFAISLGSVIILISGKRHDYFKIIEQEP